VEGKRFIRSLQLQNFLSYGSEPETIELQPLNVLIGTNASGKSNLIEAMGVLKATPTDLPAPIRQGGGIRDFLWKGEKGTPTAKIEAILDYPEGTMPLRYQISFTAAGSRLEVVDEAIEDMAPRHSSESQPFFYYRYSDRGRPVINVIEDNEQQKESCGICGEKISFPINLSYLKEKIQNYIQNYHIWEINLQTLVYIVTGRQGEMQYLEKLSKLTCQNIPS